MFDIGGFAIEPLLELWLESEHRRRSKVLLATRRSARWLRECSSGGQLAEAVGCASASDSDCSRSRRAARALAFGHDQSSSASSSARAITDADVQRLLATLVRDGALLDAIAQSRLISATPHVNRDTNFAVSVVTRMDQVWEKVPTYSSGLAPAGCARSLLFGP